MAFAPPVSLSANAQRDSEIWYIEILGYASVRGTHVVHTCLYCAFVNHLYLDGDGFKVYSTRKIGDLGGGFTIVLATCGTILVTCVRPS